MSFVIYLGWGTYKILPLDILKTLVGAGTKNQHTAIFNIRIPRMLVGISVAIALSTAGALLQTITKNELADPSIVGINSGAAVASVIYISLTTSNYYSSLESFSIYLLPFVAICGSGVSSIFIYFLSGREKIKPMRLLLVGLGINTGLNAFITFITFKGGVGEYNKVLIWISGSLWGAGWSYAKVILPLISFMFFIVYIHYKKLDVLSLSDEHAISLGLNLENERKIFLTSSVILAGGATAFAGNIGFIGLICPHIARKLVGPYHKNFLLVSAAISIIIVLFADSVSRNLFSPVEIPVGITISIFAVPYFMYLMMKEQ